MKFNQEEADKALEIAEQELSNYTSNPPANIEQHRLRLLSRAVISLSKELRQYKTVLPGSFADEFENGQRE